MEQGDVECFANIVNLTECINSKLKTLPFRPVVCIIASFKRYGMLSLRREMMIICGKMGGGSVGGGEVKMAIWQKSVAVSFTHLTLPTKGVVVDVGGVVRCVRSGRVE